MGRLAGGGGARGCGRPCPGARHALHNCLGNLLQPRITRRNSDCRRVCLRGRTISLPPLAKGHACKNSSHVPTGSTCAATAVFAFAPAAKSMQACGELANAAAVRGAALLVVRGNCDFGAKAAAGAAAGAAAVLVGNSENEYLTMSRDGGGDEAMPVAMLSQTDFEHLRHLVDSLLEVAAAYGGEVDLNSFPSYESMDDSSSIGLAQVCCQRMQPARYTVWVCNRADMQQRRKLYPLATAASINVLVLLARFGLFTTAHTAANAAHRMCPTYCTVVQGRVKPDLVAPGTMSSAAAGSGCGYIVKSGTSMSAPVVAGAALLARQYFAGVYRVPLFYHLR